MGGPTGGRGIGEGFVGGGDVFCACGGCNYCVGGCVVNQDATQEGFVPTLIGGARRRTCGRVYCRCAGWMCAHCNTHWGAMVVV